MTWRGPLVARPYAPADAAEWDGFVAASPTGTFQHSRAFLGYHGDRFVDASLVLHDAAGRMCGVLPAAVDPGDATQVVSHAGATYGGLLLADTHGGLDAFEALEAVRVACVRAGFARLLYKSVPMHVHAGASQVDVYALWRAGASLCRRDLWNVIDLRRPRVVEKRRQRRLQRARDSDIRIVRDDTPAAYARFHPVLARTLADGHGVAPVHSAAEMTRLHDLFPERVALWLALDGGGDLLAGEWIFDLGTVAHGQYGAATADGRERSAQDLLLHTLIEHHAGRGTPWFSFGASTESAGRVLNTGLFKYKASFGPGAVVQDFYMLDFAASMLRDAPVGA